ncbi:MAG TPA: cell division protein FtsA [Armatimonadota bacterium]
MSIEPYVAGLDVGTTKIRTVVARPEADGKLRILGVGVVPADGLARGIVLDRARATAAINESVRRAERNASVEIGGAYVGISGAHIACRNVTGRVSVPTGDVTAADIEKVIQTARDNVRPAPEQEIIHCLVRDFAVDGEPGIARPQGMRGNRLDVEVHVVTGVGSIIANLGDCVEETGVKALKHVLEPVATATAVLSEAERDLGVILIDIGGGTSDVAVFHEGAICHTASIPVAGNHVTRDLAQLLRIDPEEADTAKRRFGVALADLASADETIQLVEIGTEQETRVPRRLLGEIIQPRMEEIFNLVKENLQVAGVYETVGGGVVLSGGGSLLAGAARLASQIMDDLPVRVGAPRNLTGMADSVQSPIFSTAVGLAMLAAQDQAWAMPDKTAPVPAWWVSMCSWWQKLTAPPLPR